VVSREASRLVHQEVHTLHHPLVHHNPAPHLVGRNRPLLLLLVASARPSPFHQDQAVLRAHHRTPVHSL